MRGNSVFKNLFANKVLILQASNSQDNAVVWTLQSLLDEQSIAQSGKFPTNYLPSSTQFPSLSLVANVELFVKLVSNEFSLIEPRIRQDNITYQQRLAIKELKHMKDVVIKQSDKGENVVVWPTKLHEREAMRQLQDTTCSKKLTYNPTS